MVCYKQTLTTFWTSEWAKIFTKAYNFLGVKCFWSVYRVLSYQAEFHRLSLGFKCDMFTLEKRLRLEERSRDLAEENVRKEVNSCKGLLQVWHFVHSLQA